MQAQLLPSAPRVALNLFPYQREAVGAIQAAYREGVRRPALSAATGSGKTIMFAKVIEESAERALVIAHRKEIIEQAAQKVGYVIDPADVGIVMADRNQFDAPVVVASIQTLTNPRRLARLGQFGLVVIDEAHHAASPSYVDVLGRLGVGAGLGTKALGVSATWDRADGLGMDHVFDRIVYTVGIEHLIATGHLADIRALTIETQLDTSGVPDNGGGDFNAEALSRRIVDSDYADTLAHAVVQHAANRISLVFAPNVRTADLFRDALRDAGIAAESVNGETPRHDRERIVADLRAGRVRAVVNCGVFTEGTDLPIVDCVVMGRPTRSRALYQQMAGRGLRRYPGKTDCIAEGERVLTDRGLVPIEKVTTAMKVWDGEEFVSHQGVVCKGEQEVITYAGITATPDHKVWTRTGWRTLEECARDTICISVTGAGRTPLRETHGYRRGTHQTRLEEVPTCQMHDLRQRGDAGQERPSLRERRVSDVRQSQASAQVALSSCQFGEIALHKSEGQSVRPVRVPGNRVPIRVAVGNGVVGARTSRAASEHGTGPDRQQPALRGWESSVRLSHAQYRQQPRIEGECRVSRLQAEPPGSDVRRHDTARNAAQGHDSGGDCGSIPSAFDKAKRRVWDILNAGPRHRFTCEGLLVSNCLILDLVGNATRLPLQTAASLLGRTPKDGTAEITSFRQWIAEPELHGSPVSGPGPEVKGVLGQAFMQSAQAVELVDRDRLAWAQMDIATFSLPAGEQGQVVLRQDPRGTYEVLQFGRDRSRRELGSGLDIGYAQGVAEAFVMEAGAETLVDPNATWRKRKAPATDKQRAALDRWRIPYEPEITKVEASDLLDRAITRANLRRKEGAA